VDVVDDEDDFVAARDAGGVISEARGADGGVVDVECAREVECVVESYHQSPEFQFTTPHKKDKFYPQSPHVPLHESYTFVTQHNNPGQTYPPWSKHCNFLCKSR
jgi:hypothetical protein